MSFTSWLQNLRSALAPGRGQRQHRRRGSLRVATRRLNVEVLEGRCLPSTFTVTNLLDSGPGSLRAAVASANANPGPDAIDFATTGTITLTSGQLDINDSLTINGPGVDALTVSGLGGGSPGLSSRVLQLTGNPTVLIANLTVANGWTASGDGGGISMAGGNLTLDHCTVSENHAEGGYGGGICMAAGTLTLNQSTVSGNSVTGYAQWAYGGGGGGIYMAAGTLALNQSNVSGNEARYSYELGDGLGGGLYVAGGTLTLDNSTVHGNTAIGSSGLDSDHGLYGGSGKGGGLYVIGGMVSINQSSVYDNLAEGGNGGVDPYLDPVTGGDGGWAWGGGICHEGGTLEIRQSTIYDNRAVGGLGGSGWGFNGLPGYGVGGGLFLQGSDLDTFTVDHTITNNPADIVGYYHLTGMPRLAIGDLTVHEGNTGTTDVVFSVSLSAASDQDVTLNYATADGTATAGSDYVAAAGTLTIPAGQMTGTITALVNGDRLAEPNETIVVNLSAPVNATIGDGQGIGTILDDEPLISINDVTVTEGNTGTVNATFTVSLSVAYDVAVTVHYQTANGSATAGSDYAAASGDVTIAAGQTTKTFTVAVIGDRSAEPTGTFVVNLSAANNGLIVDSQGVGTILDNEPRFSISDVTKAEGKNRSTTLFTFTVTLSAVYDQAVTMSYRTVDGSAKTSESDYVAKTGMLTFAPGETTKTITIEVIGDNKMESNETFYLDLFGNSSNSLFAKNRGIGTILNDD